MMVEAPLLPENGEVSGDIGLEHLFELQNRASSHNYGQSKLLQEAVSILDKSIRLNLSMLGSMRFGADKQTVIRRFAVDALSHIVVGARVGLWGALTESSSVLRGGVESSAQLAYVVSKGLYGTAVQELNGKRFRQLEFKAACRGLGKVGASYLRFHGELSNRSAHSTSSRLRRVEYEHLGESYDRLGCSTDAKSAAVSISMCLRLIQNVGVSLATAYKQERQSLRQEWIIGLRELRAMHQALRNQIRMNVGTSGARG